MFLSSEFWLNDVSSVSELRFAILVEVSTTLEVSEALVNFLYRGERYNLVNPTTGGALRSHSHLLGFFAACKWAQSIYHTSRRESSHRADAREVNHFVFHEPLVWGGEIVELVINYDISWAAAESKSLLSFLFSRREFTAFACFFPAAHLKSTIKKKLCFMMQLINSWCAPPHPPPLVSILAHCCSVFFSRAIMERRLAASVNILSRTSTM